MYELPELGRIMFAGKRVRVVSVGQEAHLNIHAFFQQHVNTSYRSLDAGCITVVKHRHVIGEAVNQADLSRCQGSARRSHYVLYAGLVHGDNIGIAFHQKTPVLLYNRLFGKVDAIQLITLMVNFRFG